jgi:hypothetical protein
MIEILLGMLGTFPVSGPPEAEGSPAFERVLGDALALRGPAVGPLEASPPPSLQTRIRDDDAPRGFLNDLQFVWRGQEYDEITFLTEDEVDGEDEFDYQDTRRFMTGIRYRGGSVNVGFRAGVYLEKLELRDDTDVGEDDIEGFAFEVGIEGVPPLTRDSPVTPILDYEARLGSHFLNGDDVVDGLFYLEAMGRFGFGIDAYGAQLTGGVMGSGIAGAFDLQDDVKTSTGTDGDVLLGSNFAGYVRAAYAARDVPVLAEIQVIFGQIRGVVMAAGIRF